MPQFGDTHPATSDDAYERFREEADEFAFEKMLEQARLFDVLWTCYREMEATWRDVKTPMPRRLALADASGRLKEHLYYMGFTNMRTM